MMVFVMNVKIELFLKINNVKYVILNVKNVLLHQTNVKKHLKVII